MTAPHYISAEQALNMIEAALPPLDFGEGKAIYRTALRRFLCLAGQQEQSFVPGDLLLEPALIESTFARLKPPATPQEKRARADHKTRLKTILRRTVDIPRSSPEWERLESALREIFRREERPDKQLIPVTSTLKTVALQDNLSPAEMTTAWLSKVLAASGTKQAKSLRTAARLLDQFHPVLPDGSRPLLPFGDLGQISGHQRRSTGLPPTLTHALRLYLDDRVGGETGLGLAGEPIIVSRGIKQVSTTIYVQALGSYARKLVTA